MIKAATIPLCLILLLASHSTSYPQNAGLDTAVGEAVYRQANTMILRQKLVDARTAQNRGNLVSAAKLYDEAWDLVQRIGITVVQPEAEETKPGLAVVR